jgi:hypothetical protein
MKTFDFGLYIVSYNLVIGVLLILASEKIGVYAGYFMGSYKDKVNRLTHVGVFTFGICVALLSGFVLLFAHILRWL